jgi:hypothetical protein
MLRWGGLKGGTQAILGLSAEKGLRAVPTPSRRPFLVNKRTMEQL